MSCQKNAPSKEQTLRISLKNEPCSFDPRKGNDMVASQIHYLLFEGLVRLNPDMSLSPAAAESYEISPDGKIYTFHLRDALWSDGTKVTALDFEHSWKKILDPKFPSPDAYLLYAVRGAKSAKEGLISLAEVGIHARDEKTLIVELESPMFHFLQIVASSVLLPVSSKMDQLDPTWSMRKETILSNGPFCLEEWQPRQQLMFAKNPCYHGAKSVKLDHILVDIIEREMPVLHMHASGHFDLVGTPLSFFPSEILEDLDKQQLLTFFPVAATKFLAFNTSAPPFHNANIRKAFGLAISRKLLVNHITRLKEETALNIISPVLMGESNAYFEDGDVDEARKFFQKGLEELERTNLPPLTFMFVPSEINKSLAQALQQIWLETLGVTVMLEQTEFKELHSRSQKGNFSIGIFAWLADYADPMNILERFADKTNHRNYPKWEHPAYNQLLTEIRNTTSKTAYLTKVKQAEELLIEEMPFTCLFHENYAFLVHPHVKGLEISPLGHIYFERISIDHSQKL